jgi:hypothetical protein
MYNPGDTVHNVGWDYDPHERKKRIRYKIHAEDKFILNYDQLEMKDIEFYLSSRVDRPNYLDMMPVLEKVKTLLIAESKKEVDFANMIVGQVSQRIQLSQAEIEKRVRETIQWWKYKNQIKRAITKDDTLALRMIIKRVCSVNYKTLKP